MQAAAAALAGMSVGKKEVSACGIMLDVVVAGCVRTFLGFPSSSIAPSKQGNASPTRHTYPKPPKTKVGILNARDVRRLITGLDSESARSKEMSVAVRFEKRGLICVCTYALSSVIRAHPIHRSRPSHPLTRNNTPLIYKPHTYCRNKQKKQVRRHTIVLNLDELRCLLLYDRLIVIVPEGADPDWYMAVSDM